MNDLHWERYRDVDGDSGVSAYVIGAGSIQVRFKDGHEYLYTDRSAGPHNIADMHRLARAGDGLNSFINRRVRKKYERRVR